LTAIADVRQAHGKYSATADNLHEKDQWCSVAVAAAAGKTTCTFSTASRGEYAAILYCETIEGWFFASKSVNVTAKDNGGKPVSLSLTYKKAIDDVAQNGVVLKICGKLAENMAVPYARVTDAYGGYFNNPSATLPAASATPAKPATNTTNTTKRMLNTTKNTTTPAKTEWVLNLFVQPDPFAEKVDNAATVTAATSTSALAAVDTVTKATYGAMTAKAAAVTEKAVKWVAKPKATGGAKQITIAGSTDVGGYVYCAVSKTGTSTAKRRMLNTNTTNNTNNVTKTPSATNKVTNLQSASVAKTHHVQRTETKTGALTFSQVFKGLLEGSAYSWMCEATSLSPSAPLFRTAMESGSATTDPAPVVPAADSALWSSLFAAILMIAAVFFF